MVLTESMLWLMVIEDSDTAVDIALGRLGSTARTGMTAS